MKKIIIILLFILFAEQSKSQDLIVTNNNDSINCQIVEKKGSFTIYRIRVDGAVQSRALKDEFILKTEVGYYLNKPNNEKYIIANQKETKKIFMFNVGINKSSLLEYYNGSGPTQLDAYYTDLTNTASFNAEVEALLSNKFSLGLRYELYKSDAEYKDLPVPGPSNTYLFDLDEDLIIHTISPKFSFRKNVFDEKNLIVLSAMYDYNLYNNIFTIEESGSSYSATGDISGKSSGVSFAASYERVISNDFRVGLTGMYKMCTVKKVEINGVEQSLVGSNQINLNRLNIGLYISFR